MGCSGGATVGESHALPLIGDASSITQNPDGTFTVVCKNGTTEIDTAAQIQANQVCLAKAGNPGDPFDPASCSGPALTPAQANAYVNLTNGIQDIKVGRFQVYRRWRQIYQGWPAGVWQTTGVSDIVNTNGLGVYNGYSYSYYYFYADSSNGLAKVPMQGEVHIDYDNNRPLISLYGDTASYVQPQGSVDPTVAFDILDWDFTTSTIPGPVYSTSTNLNFGLTFAGHQSFGFTSAVATPTCVRFFFDGTEPELDSDNNNWTKESQLVVLGTIGS
jgi:hypothetical protein